MNAPATSRNSPAQSWARALLAISSLDTGEWRGLPGIIDDIADQNGAKIAMISLDGPVSYECLRREKNRFANWASTQSLGGDDVVCLLMRNCPSYIAVWLGVIQAGATVALINTNLRGTLLQQAIASASPGHVILGHDMLHALENIQTAETERPLYWVLGEETQAAPSDGRLNRIALDYQPADAQHPPIGPDRTALLIYTSGTTGMPKAARISHHRVLEWSLWFAGMMDAGPDDVLYSCLPMYHSTGGVACIGAVFVHGGTVVIRDRFSVRNFWRDIVAYKCSLFLYIGELCRYLVDAPDDPLEKQHGLRLCCGNGLQADVWRRFQERFGVPQILEFYASTEGNVALYNCEGQVGAVGRVPGYLTHRFPVALIACDAETGEAERDANGRCRRCPPEIIGEAIGKITNQSQGGSGHFEGYTDTEATERKILRDVFTEGDAWYRTGDLMRRDRAGFFYFIDRMGDTFRSKGENVATTQVAAALCRCPGVTNAAVYGVVVPGEEGRVGMAAITISGEFDFAALLAAVRTCLPSYARPRFLRICSELPTTGTFKTVKTKFMREGYADPGLTDPIYVEDAAAGTYIRITPTTPLPRIPASARIAAG